MVISIGSLYYTKESTENARTHAETGRSEAERRGLLEISDANVLFTTVDGRQTGEGGAVTKDLKVLAPQIDLRVRNRGPGEARIGHVEVIVHSSRVLEGCGPATGEGISVSENYTVSIPSDQAPPFSLIHRLDFRVRSGSYDRFRLILGPENETPLPWVGAVSLRLHSDDGDDLKVGPFALVTPGEFGPLRWDEEVWKLDPRSRKDCVRRNAATVAMLRRLPYLVEPAVLVDLDKALRTF